MLRLIGVVVLLGVGISGGAQIIQEPERTTDWDRFEVRSNTRLGRTTFGGGIPETIEFENPRFSEGFKFGRNNSFLGVDYDAPGSRFRETEPGQYLKPSEFLGEKAEKLSSGDSASVNRPAPADVAGSQRAPIRRPTGFFQRPELMEPPLSAEELLRTPREQRWFRERGGPRQAVESSESVGAGALGVGGEDFLRQADPTARIGAIRSPNPPLNPADARRKIEEKLEGLLLSDPGVHLLSPVRVSFNNGIATVRGVVPNQTHKVAVGNILLSDPVVKQVNNMISVAPIDPNGNPPPIDAR